MTDDLNGRTAVYRFFDEEGSLLYVGIAVHPRTRWRAHAAEKQWWPSVARKTVEWCDTREEAADREYEAIAAENPMYNVVRDRRRFHLIKAPTRRPRQPIRLSERQPVPPPPPIFAELVELSAATDPVIRARVLGRALDSFPDFQVWLGHTRREAVLAMREEGQSYGDIAKNLGFSRSRAQQIVEGRVTGRRAKPTTNPEPAE